MHEGEVVLVVGGCGFIGRSLVEELAKTCRLVIVMDNFENPNSYFPEHWNNLPILMHRADAAFYPNWILLKVQGISSVYHLACTQQLKSYLNPERSIQVDLLSVNNALTFCYGTGASLFFTSSVSIESRTLSPYAVCKEAAERMCIFYKFHYGVDVTAIRYSNVYGPGNANGVVGKFLRNEPLIVTEGGFKRDFTFIDDAIKATLLLAEKKPGTIVSIGTGKAVPVEEIAVQISRTMGKTIQYRESQDEDYPLTRVVDVSGLRGTIGWVPDTDITEGVNLSIERFKNESRVPKEK